MTGSDDRATRRAAIQDRVAALAGARAQAPIQTAQAATAEQGSDAPVRAELWLYGVVGGFWFGFSSDTVAYALRSLDDAVTEIVVRLDSPGGSASQGLAIANLLANHPARVVMVVDGMAASAASQIALAGDEVVMSPGSQFMLHDAWMLTIGNAADLHSDAEWLDKQSRNYAETYAHRAGETAEHWREVMLADNGRGTWFTAAESVQAGLADRVANIASTTPPPPEPELDDGDSEAAARAALDLDTFVHPSVRAAWTDHLSASARSVKPPAQSASGSAQQEGSDMSFIDDVRSRLGVAEDADEATVVAALDEALDERAEPGNASTTAIPDGMSLVDNETLAELRAGAQDGRAARQEQLTQARDTAIQSAVTSGRIPKARREHYQKAWDADPDGTRDLLAALEPGLVPLSELGHDNPVDENQSEDDAVYASLFGDEKVS